MDFGGYFIIFNRSSGNRPGEDTLNLIKERFSDEKVFFDVIDMDSEADFTSQSERLVQAAAAKNGVVIAAGGDGTVSTTVRLCSKRSVPLGIIPLGTFNYFARNLNIPVDIDDSIDVILSGHTRKAQLGTVGGVQFINNASIGLYKDLIEARERHKSIFGRFRIVAFFSALTMFFRRNKSFLIKLKEPSGERIYRTTMLFAGNNSYQLKNIGLPIARCADERKLGVLLLKEMSGIQTVLLLARAILEGLENEPDVLFFSSDSFEISVAQKTIKLALDGEILSFPSPLSFSVDPEGLTVFVPLPAP